MNILKKTVAVLSIIVLSGSFIFAKEKSENPFDGTEPKINYNTNHPYNLGGINVVIASYMRENKKSSTNKSTRDYWYEWGFKTYNMNVIQKQAWGAEEFPKMALNYCVSDGNENYVFIIDNRMAALGVRANLFYDLSTIESVDYYNNSKYNQNTLYKLTRGRSFYAFSWEKDEPLLGVYFNKKMLQEIGYTSEYLYDLQLAGKWTWNEFERLCNKITADTDYDGETDVYAMSSDMYDFAILCLDSNNTALINRDIEGKYSSNIINTDTMEALNWMHKIWQKHQMPDKKNEGPDYCYKAFIEGKTAFMVGHQDPRIANHDFSGMNDDYGFVCFPLGPKSKGHYRTVSDTKMVVIPSCYEKSRAEKVAKAIDLWLEPIPDSKKDAWKSNYINQFRDGRVMDETVVMMHDYPNPRMDVLVEKIDSKATYKNILTGINTPEEEYFFTRISWTNVFNDYNDYVEKRGKLSEDEINSIQDEIERRIHFTKIEKPENPEEGGSANGDEKVERVKIETSVETVNNDSSEQSGKKAKKKKKK